VSKKGTNHETGKISCRGGVRDPLCRMRRGTRFRETANRARPERCLQVRRCNVGTTRTAGTQASVRARTFLESSRRIEHGKRVTVSVQPFAWLLRSRQCSDFSCLLRPLLRERPEASPCGEEFGETALHLGTPENRRSRRKALLKQRNRGFGSISIAKQSSVSCLLSGAANLA
jgi:hypothetical protein